MSDNKQARTMPSVTPRSVAESRAPSARRGVTSARPRTRGGTTSADGTPVTKATSTESIAASIVSLMVLAADHDASSKVDTNDKGSLAATAALAELIAVRFADDD